MKIDDELVSNLREVSEAPVFLLGWEEDDPAGGFDGFEVVPPPMTAAALTKAVAIYRKPREENELLSRLLAAPGFRTFSEAAMVHLLHGASAVQIHEEEVLFEEGAAADAMFFVLAGSISLRLGDTELESVGSAADFSARWACSRTNPERHERLRQKPLCCLKVQQDTLQESDQEFRSIFFELVSRVLVRRLRSTNSRPRDR